MKPESFSPDWTVPTSHVLRRAFEHVDWDAFAAIPGLQMQHVKSFLSGNSAITYVIAQALVDVIGTGDAAFWMRMDERYWSDLATGKTRIT